MKGHSYPVLFRLLHSNHEGMNTVEAIILFFVALTVLFGVSYVIFRYPESANKFALFGFIGLLAGVLAWSWRQVVTSLTNRGQLRILEILSSGPSLSRAEIQYLLAKEHFLYRLLPQLYFDSLSSLVMSGKVVVIEGGLYMPASKHGLREYNG